MEGLDLQLRHESITDADVDIIVNAANTVLAHAGGIAGHIQKMAGDGLYNYCRNIIA